MADEEDRSEMIGDGNESDRLWRARLDAEQAETSLYDRAIRYAEGTAVESELLLAAKRYVETSAAYARALELERDMQERRRSCNLHDDCKSADEHAAAVGYALPYHCHSDDCEDCFPK